MTTKLKGQLKYDLDFRPGVRVGKAKHDASAVATELQRIEQAKRGLRPQDVVAAARNARNPLHRYFDWDDTKAAQKWRIEQARALIASVRVTLIAAPERGLVRAFVHVDSGDDKQHYGFVQAVMSDPKRREIVLARARAELESFEHRYAEFQELAEVFKAARQFITRAA